MCGGQEKGSARRRRARALKAQACCSLNTGAAGPGGQVGIQEKTAFVVAGKKISGGQLYQPIVSIPATIELLLVRTRFRTQYIVNVLSGEQHDASHSTVRVTQRHVSGRQGAACVFCSAWRGATSAFWKKPFGSPARQDAKSTRSVNGIRCSSWQHQAYACYLLVRNRKWQLLADAWLLWIGLQSSGALACMGRYPGKH